jgi:phosphatidylglycerophosphate synthase
MTRPKKHNERILGAGVRGLALVSIAALGVRTAFWLDSTYPLKAAAAFIVMVLFAFVVQDAHPFPRFGMANVVTMARAMLVALIAAAIGETIRRDLAAAIVMAIAVIAVLDGVDGWLARRTGMASPFGARIDMETDALLILVASVLVWQEGKAGAWVLAGGAMRYAFVASGWILPWMHGTLTPTLRAKTITICHVVGLCVALAPIVPWPLSAAAVGTTTAALAWSFAVDVGRLWKQRVSNPKAQIPNPKPHT